MAALLIWSCGVASEALPPQPASPTRQQAPCRQVPASRVGRGLQLLSYPPDGVQARHYSATRLRTLRRSGSLAGWCGCIVGIEHTQSPFPYPPSPFPTLTEPISCGANVLRAYDLDVHASPTFSFFRAQPSPRPRAPAWRLPRSPPGVKPRRCPGWAASRASAQGARRAQPGRA